MKPRSCLFRLGALLLLAATVHAGEVYDFHRELPLTKDGRVSLSNITGAIVVEAWDQPKLVIDAQKEAHGGAAEAKSAAEAVEIDVEAKADAVRIETRYPKRGWTDVFSWWSKHNKVSVNYHLKVPRRATVQLESVSGEIEVRGLAGQLGAESVSGDARLSDLSGGARIESVSGEIRMRNISGPIDVESVSGSIEVIGGEGDFSGATVSGDIELTELRGSRVSASSVSGDLDFSGPLAAGGRYEFESQSGDITLTVLDTTGFRVDAETFSGDIDVSGVGFSDLRRERNRFSGSHGDGSARLTCDTFSGDVTIELQR
ncbi:MAG TPA: DUF4097 family beta strand repeat-containing protein [Acidobacteriota bacterium]